jgi:hypothetical protein
MLTYNSALFLESMKYVSSKPVIISGCLPSELKKQLLKLSGIK